MKLRLSYAVILISLFSQAHGELLWAKGIECSNNNWRTATGWHDANKDYTYLNDGDNNLCWAASASNLVAWWQDLHPGAAQTANAPSDLDEIWDVFKTSFQDGGGFTYAGVRWWLDGKQPAMPGTKQGASEAGYYKELFNFEEGYDITDFLKDECVDEYYYDPYWGSYPDVYNGSNLLEAVSCSLKEMLSNGMGVSLYIGSLPDGSTLVGSAHAITLWGIDYNEESGLVEKLYVTDSDDISWGYNGLVELSVSAETARKASIYEGFPSVEMFTVQNTDESGFASLGDAYRYMYKGDYALYGYSYLDSALPVVYSHIPEPASGTLGLLALSALAARPRRRK